MKNLVAIVGRPNVGKSTLFNRLVEENKAITDNNLGTTRDRSFGSAQWNGIPFTVIDTGGYINDDESFFSKKINEQILIALNEADVILFVVDAKVGVHPMDSEILKIIKQTKKQFILVANKADNYNLLTGANDFFLLGIPSLVTISSINGSGTGDLLDELVKSLNKTHTPEDLNMPKIAILGRPNVGKSTFLNAILGTERFITSNIPGTTRDAIDSHYNLYGHDFIFTDTAGLRKKNKEKENVEFYSTMRSIKAMEKADVCIIMIDAEKGIEIQDINIIALAHKNKKGILIVVNKWDLVEKDNNTMKEFEKHILERIKPIKGAPIIFCSSLTKQRIFKVLEETKKVYDRLKTKISTSKLNDILLPIIRETPPPAIKGKYIKIKYITQLPVSGVRIAFFCNLPQYLTEHYKRFLESKLRDNFDLLGVPLTIIFKQK